MRTMVFKILQSSAQFHGIAYNEKKVVLQSAGQLYHENFGYLQGQAVITKEEFQNYLIKYAASNERVKKPQFHATLSAKGREHSFEQLKSVALTMMYELGYAGNPILMYSHADTANNHIHIISSRVDMYGKKIRDNREGIRATAVLNRVLGIDDHEALTAAIDYAKGYVCATFPQFAGLVESRGFKGVRSAEGYSFHKSGQKIGNCSIHDITLESKPSVRTKQRIVQLRAILYKYKIKWETGAVVAVSGRGQLPQQESSDFLKYIERQLPLKFIVFKSAQGMPYGYSIIDHQHKLVVKGSDVIPLETLMQAVTATNQAQVIQTRVGHVPAKPVILEAGPTLSISVEGAGGSILDGESGAMHNDSTAPLKKKKRKKRRLHL
jgi:hypothetical protein